MLRRNLQINYNQSKENKMKNRLYVSIILFAFSILNAEAQNNSSLGKPSFGIYGGINFQNINGNDDSGTKLSNSLVPRFTVGINGQIPIAPSFYFQAGLRFISKGTKGPVEYNDNAGTRTITREIVMNYLEIPLDLVFKPMLGNGNMILGFGPYIGYSFSGKAKFTGSSAPADTKIQFEKTVPSNESNNLIYFKPLDVGADFFVGYELNNGISIILNSQLGLININSDTNTKLTNKNTGFGLLVGYSF
jgi:hypothetical protein